MTTRCKRCDAEAQCGTCHAIDKRNAFCWCGHTRAMHHHEMGCLARMAGDLCMCELFELREEVA